MRNGQSRKALGIDLRTLYTCALSLSHTHVLLHMHTYTDFQAHLKSAAQTLAFSHTLWKSVSKARCFDSRHMSSSRAQAYQPFSSRLTCGGNGPIVIKCLNLAHSITGQRAAGTSACGIYHNCYWLPCKCVFVCVYRSVLCVYGCKYVCEGVCMLLEAVRGCAALVGTIIQLEKHKCSLPKLKQKKMEKSLNVSKIGTNECG